MPRNKLDQILELSSFDHIKHIKMFLGLQKPKFYTDTHIYPIALKK